ncbi:hypothetical protein C6P46_004219 [Rhodotorula mucilaginosa]|uniref:Mannose-P-dolichol utilization defect 1 protein homolog n=1 Tax=Rhodotorula mucilaginosa TaxID=5537 RepID=A0A9P7B5N4_RHOMI|nr:hypothetical protein C6P46_004219 [Rhodotorula mucilaginosa]
MAAFVSNQLQPLKAITHNLPAAVTEPAVALIGQVSPPQTDVLPAAVVLGLGMVAGGAILKLPQILTVVRSGSARGLSLSSYVLDTVATGITAILIVLITSYSARPTLPRLVPLVALLGSLAYALASPSLVPASTLSFLQTLTIPISLSSKVPQIVENYKAKSTGQLSAFLVVNSLAGCLARVFTTMSETKDPLLLWNFALAALLNGVIFAQMILYRGNTTTTSSRRAIPPSSSSRQGTLPHVAVAEKATAVKDQVVAAGVASAGQEQEHLQQQEHSTPKKNPKAAAGHAAAVTGSGGPGSAGRRYVRKLD